jgi:hypothetical protein
VNKLGVKKRNKTKSSKGGRLRQAGSSALSAVLGTTSKRGGGGGGKRRKHGPTWYANKILVEKMKKKLNKIKFGGMR